MKNGLLDVVQSNRDPPLTMQLSLYGRTDAYVSGPYTYQDLYKTLVGGEEGMAISVQENMIGGEYKMIDCTGFCCPPKEKLLWLMCKKSIF